MANEEDDAKKMTTNQFPKNLKLKIFFLVILTNLITEILYRNPHSFYNTFNGGVSESHLPLNTTTISGELRATQAQLEATRNLLTDLQNQLSSAVTTIQSLREQKTTTTATSGGGDDVSAGVISGLPEEAKLAVGPHKFPLGRNPKARSDQTFPPVGAACLRFKDEFLQYMQYEVGGECPNDDGLAQKLMLNGCEPLPKRRCHPKSPAGYPDPKPLPDSLWSVPPDNSLIWDPYPCKSYQCLIDRITRPGFPDCKDCFYLDGREKHRWLTDNGNVDYSIDYVLGSKPEGTIRVGLDLGGGTGSFAARMWDRNITIVTTSMNFDGPFNSFIASRGLIAMHVTISQRLPFFENTLDIVHSMHVLSNWIPDAMLEFTLYDIYRVLRPGGLFWLDRFFCYGSQLNETYVPMFGRVGFNKRRWNVGMKTDRGSRDEWYLSALLEKPMS